MCLFFLFIIIFVLFLCLGVLLIQPSEDHAMRIIYTLFFVLLPSLCFAGDHIAKHEGNGTYHGEAFMHPDRVKYPTHQCRRYHQYRNPWSGRSDKLVTRCGEYELGGWMAHNKPGGFQTEQLYEF